MGEIVNLRQARKRRGRAAAEDEAAANRARHGRPKAETKGVEAERRRADHVLDQHRIEPGEGGSGDG